MSWSCDKLSNYWKQKWSNMQSIGIFINKENARTYFLQHQQLMKFYLRKRKKKDGGGLKGIIFLLAEEKLALARNCKKFHFPINSRYSSPVLIKYGIKADVSLQFFISWPQKALNLEKNALGDSYKDNSVFQQKYIFSSSTWVLYYKIHNLVSITLNNNDLHFILHQVVLQNHLCICTPSW